MLFENFVSELTGFPGRQVRFANPQDLEQALQIALTVQEAEREERFNDSFYTQFEKSVRLCSKSPGRSRPENESQRQSADSRTRDQRYSTTSRGGRSGTTGSRDTMTQAVLRCYECKGMGHYAKECPTRKKRLNPSSPHTNKRVSSFFLSVQKTVAKYHTASLHLRRGKPTVRIKIRGARKDLIVDSGSAVSLIKPGISRSKVRSSSMNSF
jgi:hypothetical protein